MHAARLRPPLDVCRPRCVLRLRRARARIHPPAAGCPSAHFSARPQYSLPDIETARAYLQHPMLAQRLREITRVAVGQLGGGARPLVLFGGSTDATKFVETMTLFAVVALEAPSVC